MLLKNDGNLLPVGTAKRIAVIGGHADKGVISGGGSSQVYPDGGNAVPGIGPTIGPGRRVLSLVAVAGAEGPAARATVAYASGDDPRRRRSSPPRPTW